MNSTGKARASGKAAPAARGGGTVRIIGGKFRRRQLRVPEVPGLRPTPDRVRETLFNWLGQDLSGLACLDLFAGSGALGFEAASRGAASVVLVEQDRGALRELERGRNLLAADQVRIVPGDALAFLEREAGRFHLVFLDPPFRQNALPAILQRLPARLEAGARVYVESESAVQALAPWVELRQGKAGQVRYQLLQWLPPESPAGHSPGEQA